MHELKNIQAWVGRKSTRLHALKKDFSQIKARTPSRSHAASWGFEEKWSAYLNSKTPPASARARRRARAELVDTDEWDMEADRQVPAPSTNSAIVLTCCLQEETRMLRKRA